MVNKDLLKSVDFFDDFPDETLERLAKIADLREYQEGEYLNRRRRSADNLYIILHGAISLETENIEGEIVHLETLVDGAALGFSSLVDIEPRQYLSDARIITPTKALRFRADDILSLCYQDLQFGFLIMKKIALIAKQRLLYRTQPLDNIFDLKAT